MHSDKSKDQLSEFIFDLTRLEELCTESEWEKLTKLQSEIKLKKGQVLFYEDTDPIGIYCVHSGAIKLYKTSPGGKQHILQLSKDCEILGIIPCYANMHHSVSAEAMEETMVSIIPKGDFIKLVDKNDDLKSHIILNLSHIIVAYRRKMLDLATKPVKSRLAEVLLYLDIFYDVHPDGDSFHMSRDNIAAMVGTSRETVIRILSDFQENDLIRLINRNIQILDGEKLKEISHYS